LRFLVVDGFSALGMGMCFYLVPVYAVDLGIGAGAFLLMFGGSHLFAIPFTVAGGVLTDRWNRKALFVGNYAIEVAMLAAFALAGGKPLFVVGIALFVLQTTFEPAVLAYFFDQFEESEAGTAWGLDGTVTRGIGIVAPPIGAAVYGVQPRSAFVAGTVFMTLSTVVALTLPD
jgi:predicted MFS family arabinose efflux permease